MIVIDASAIIQVLVGRDPGPALLDAVAGDLAAPHILDVEVLSALRGMVLGGVLPLEAAGTRPRSSPIAYGRCALSTPATTPCTWRWQKGWEPRSSPVIGNWMPAGIMPRSWSMSECAGVEARAGQAALRPCDRVQHAACRVGPSIRSDGFGRQNTGGPQGLQTSGRRGPRYPVDSRRRLDRQHRRARQARQNTRSRRVRPQGVDRLELGVHERGLDERGVGGAVEVCHEVVQQCWHQFGRWRAEVCLERVVRVSSEPILRLPDTVMLRRIGEQAAVERQ